MCTVTYLPVAKSSFILTSNRDESQYRKTALPPEHYVVHGTNVCFPKDAEANGTWLATAENNFTLCLLNGAFGRHERHPPYRLSRGLVLLDFFAYNNVRDFLAQYNFQGIEPFTLLIFEQNNAAAIHEVRWDEKKIYSTIRDPLTPHIWSSPQLYPESVIQQRERSFGSWLKAKNEFTVYNIVRFHKIPGNLLTNKDGFVFTVSITSVKKDDEECVMRYEDVVSGAGIMEMKTGFQDRKK